MKKSPSAQNTAQQTNKKAPAQAMPNETNSPPTVMLAVCSIRQQVAREKYSRPPLCWGLPAQSKGEGNRLLSNKTQPENMYAVPERTSEPAVLLEVPPAVRRCSPSPLAIDPAWRAYHLYRALSRASARKNKHSPATDGLERRGGNSRSN